MVSDEGKKKKGARASRKKRKALARPIMNRMLKTPPNNKAVREDRHGRRIFGRGATP